MRTPIDAPDYMIRAVQVNSGSGKYRLSGALRVTTVAKVSLFRRLGCPPGLKIEI